MNCASLSPCATDRPGASTRRAGFTLVEMMVVIAILAIIAVFAVPSFRATLVNTRMSSAISDLQASLMHARTEALQRSTPVVVAPSGASWLSGWTTTLTPAVGAATQLQTHPAVIDLAKDSSIAVSVATGPFAVGSSLRFDGQGFARQAVAGSAVSGGFLMGCMSLTSENGKVVSIIMAASGRLRTCEPSKDTTCVAECAAAAP